MKPILPKTGVATYRSLRTDAFGLRFVIHLFGQGSVMSRTIQGMVWGLVAVATILASSNTQANPPVRWGVSIGNGGGVRVGFGNGPIYGPGYGPGYYGPYGYRAPVVIAPQPIYVPPPVYVQPQPVYVQPQPQYSPTPVLPAAPSPYADGGEIVLFSPSTTTSDIRYTLNGHQYTMRPGTKQRFTNDRTWTVQFESHPGHLVSYTLHSVHYKFKQTESGLGLFQTHDTPEATQPGLPPAPIPNPPEAPEFNGTVIPSRPTLKTLP